MTKKRISSVVVPTDGWQTYRGQREKPKYDEELVKITKYRKQWMVVHLLSHTHEIVHDILDVEKR